MNLRYLNMSQLSEVTGVDRRTVKSRLEGVEPYRKNGQAVEYDAREVIPLVIGVEKADDKNIYKQLQKEQIRTERAKAEKIELEVAKTKGELVSIEDVCRTVGKEYTYVRSSILSLPVKLAKSISLENDPAVCRSMLKQEVDEILKHLQADINLDISPEENDDTYFPEDENLESETNVNRVGEKTT